MQYIQFLFFALITAISFHKNKKSFKNQNNNNNTYDTINSVLYSNNKDKDNEIQTHTQKRKSPNYVNLNIVLENKPKTEEPSSSNFLSDLQQN